MTMAATTIAKPGFDLGRIAQSIAPGRIAFDPLGLVSGYRAYLIHTGLAAKADSELAAMGLDRADLPRIAVEAAQAARRG